MTVSLAPDPNPDTLTEAYVDPDALPDLEPRDRCDRCPSQAYVRVRMPSGLELLFCGHDYAKHADALATSGAKVRDERARLLETYSDVEATELADS